MKYGEIVQDLASRGFNWQFYDENFRFLRHSSASTLPWGGMHWELWLRAQPSPPVFNKRFPPAANHYKPDSASQRVPHGYCFKFHRDLECAGVHLNMHVFSVNVTIVRNSEERVFIIMIAACRWAVQVLV